MLVTLLALTVSHAVVTAPPDPVDPAAGGPAATALPALLERHGAELLAQVTQAFSGWAAGQAFLLPEQHYGDLLIAARDELARRYREVIAAAGKGGDASALTATQDQELRAWLDREFEARTAPLVADAAARRAREQALLTAEQQARPAVVAKAQEMIGRKLGTEADKYTGAAPRDVVLLRLRAVAPTLDEAIATARALPGADLVKRFKVDKADAATTCAVYAFGHGMNAEAATIGGQQRTSGSTFTIETAGGRFWLVEADPVAEGACRAATDLVACAQQVDVTHVDSVKDRPKILAFDSSEGKDIAPWSATPDCAAAAALPQGVSAATQAHLCALLLRRQVTERVQAARGRLAAALWAAIGPGHEGWRGPLQRRLLVPMAAELEKRLLAVRDRAPAGATITSLEPDLAAAEASVQPDFAAATADAIAAQARVESARAERLARWRDAAARKHKAAWARAAARVGTWRLELADPAGTERVTAPGMSATPLQQLLGVFASLDEALAAARAMPGAELIVPTTANREGESGVYAYGGEDGSEAGPSPALLDSVWYHPIVGPFVWAGVDDEAQRACELHERFSECAAASDAAPTDHTKLAFWYYDNDNLRAPVFPWAHRR